MKELPKVVRTPQFFTILFDQLLDDYVVDIWNQALATVACTFCRPHLEKVVWTRQFFFLRVLCEIQLLLQSRAHFAHLIFKKWSAPVSFLRNFYVKSSSCGVHVLSTSSSKSGLDPSVFFLRLLCEFESRAHFADLILKKWSGPIIFLRLLCEIELLWRARFVDLIFEK